MATSQEPEQSKARRRQALKYPSSEKGMIIPIKSATELLFLQYSQIHNLVKKGELPAFRYAGIKLVPYDPVSDLKRSVQGQSLYLYTGDIEEYLARDLIRVLAEVTTSKTVSYTKEEEEQVVAEAKKYLAENQQEDKEVFVSRSEIMRRLGWSTREFAIIRDVLNKHNFPMQYSNISRYERAKLLLTHIPLEVIDHVNEQRPGLIGSVIKQNKDLYESLSTERKKVLGIE